MDKPTSTSSANQYLLDSAIQSGDAMKATKAMKLGASPNVTLVVGFRPINLFAVLHMDRSAARDGIEYYHLLWPEPDDRSIPKAEKLDVLQAILDHGANPNASDGFTPLMMASAYGFTGSIRTLIAHGALVNKRGVYGYTALQMAIHGGHPELTVPLLLANGADPDTCDEDGDTAVADARKIASQSSGQARKSWANLVTLMEAISKQKLRRLGSRH